MSSSEPRSILDCRHPAPLDHEKLRLSEKTRKYPVVMDADALDETVRVQLPGDFKIDELPPPVHLDSAFGRFDATWAVEAGSLVFKRTIEIPAQTVPAAKYQELRKFFDEVGGSRRERQAPLCLALRRSGTSSARPATG